MVSGKDHRRREFLKLAALSVAGLTTTGARALGQAQRDVIQRPETPQRALSLLTEGNQRFVAQKLISFQEDLDILKAHSEEHQEPFAAVLSCADSRVPVELAFDQSIGHLFVVRVAGNVATPIPLPAWNTGQRCWVSRQSWCLATPIAAQSKQPWRARRYRGRSALCTNTFIRQSPAPKATSPPPAGKMRGCKPRC